MISGRLKSKKIYFKECKMEVVNFETKVEVSYYVTYMNVCVGVCDENSFKNQL